jgi:hypothetical protein
VKIRPEPGASPRPGAAAATNPRQLIAVKGGQKKQTILRLKLRIELEKARCRLRSFPRRPRPILILC